MKAIHFYPRSAGINFIAHFKTYLEKTMNDNYTFVDRSTNLYSELDKRINQIDIILFTSHGEPEYFIGEKEKGTDVLIREEHLGGVKNSFIFAFACSTGELGKKLCDGSGALAYIGFNDAINLTVNTSEISFKPQMKIVLSSIYIEALIASFNEYFKKTYSVKQFAKLLSLNLKRSYSRVLAAEPLSLCHQFNLGKRLAQNPLFLKTLHSDLLTTIDAVRSRIIVHGETEFIPWDFINNEPEKVYSLIAKLENTTFASQNEYYRNFLLLCLYMKAGRTRKAYTYFKNVASLFPQFEPLSIYKVNEDDTELQEVVS